MTTAVQTAIRASGPQPSPALEAPAAQAVTSASSPPGLRQIEYAGRAQTIWPYTTAQFPPLESDPVNLAFLGRADPRSIRAALLSLDGHRPHLPPVPPFTARWKDAVGGHQAAYSGAEGWTGSVIQLECGDYQPLRFHLRLFPAGAWTLASAHLDASIPGTAEHEVVAWELARQLVVHDLQRSGLLDAAEPMGETDAIHPRVFRRIHPAVFVGLPADLRELLLGSGSILPDGRLLTSGRATVLHLAGAAPPGPRRVRRELSIEFDRVIPKPFCNRGDALVHVRGPVLLRHTVEEGEEGTLTTRVEGAGELAITPVDPVSGLPTGSVSRAEVVDHHTSVMSDHRTLVTMRERRSIVAGPLAGEAGEVELRVGPDGRVRYARHEQAAAR